MDAFKIPVPSGTKVGTFDNTTFKPQKGSKDVDKIVNVASVVQM